MFGSVSIVLLLWLVLVKCQSVFDWKHANTSVALCARAYCDRTLYTHPNIFTGFAQGFVVDTVLFDPVHDIQGFVGTMASQNAIYVVFRGSESITNWILDLDISLVNYPYCDNCKVHKGFYLARSWIVEEIYLILDVLRFRPLYRSYSIIVTGHSLGAAVATLVAMDLVEKGFPNVELINFGSPRVGNNIFSEYVSSKLEHRYRVTHNRDVVPHFPKKPLFQHISGEWYEDNSGVKECQGYEDPACADRWYNGKESNFLMLLTNTKDHMHYLGQTMHCQL